MSQDLSLVSRYSRALTSASSLSGHSALSPEYKLISDEALADLRQVAQAISDLQLFSKNETLEDVSTKQLVYFTVPYATAELLLALPSTEPSLRKEILGQAESKLQQFISYMTDYEIVDPVIIQATKRAAQMMNNPAQRREAKIQQHQTEKKLKSQIQTLRSRTLASNVEEPANNFDSIRMLLNAPESAHAGSVNAADDDPDMDDETRRELSLVLLRLLYAQAHVSLQQVADELQIIQSMPPPPSQSQQDKPRDDTWRLDMTPRGGLDGKGPLMDAQGRPLRPFTILPSNVAERTRLQQEVFRPDYRLPTMTIDEYLAEEERRGNIIRGGGKASEEAPTSSEQLAIDAERDGTRFGEEKSEEKRRKDEEWAVFTDANPRGAGNTMNRG